MKPDKILFILFLAGIGVLSFLAVQALADISDIQYPVPELRNCKSEADCRSYCDKPENIAACLSFAEQNDLMSEREIEIAEKFIAAGSKGPGGCTGKDSCETYCNDISHIEECVSFAEQNGFLPPEELEEAQKVRDAIRRGAKPPACGNKKACESYCEDPSHMEECVAFASEAGLMPEEERENAQKMLQALKRGVKPPPCRGRQACDEYCQQPDNMEVCMNFALEAGFMPEEEKENAQKMLSAIKRGVKPPNCRGREECDSYCQSDEHFEECANFAAEAGFMSEKDAEMARKTKGKGPGGCRGKEQCETFCNNPANQEICFNFAQEHGLIPPEEIEKMKEGMNRMREDLSRMPSEVKDCLRSTLGEETINKIQSGELTPGPQLGDAMQNCFQNMPPPPEGMRGQEGMSPPEGSESRSGPGGCSTPEECMAYCQANPQECQDFSPPSDGKPGQPPREQICLQVLTPARDPQTGRCVIFSNSCIPPGWTPVERGTKGCEEQEPMPPGGQMFPSPPPGFEGQIPPPEGIMPPPEGMMPPREGQFPREQFQPSEPMPQIQQQPQGEIAPPPPPPSEPAPQSILNNKYLGAIIRILAGN